MARKKVKFNQGGISKLPDNRPALYRIETDSGGLNYAGVAKRGRVRQRITEHLGNVPGSTVRVEQFSNFGDAQAKEANVIKRSQPKYNKQGK